MWLISASLLLMQKSPQVTGYFWEPWLLSRNSFPRRIVRQRVIFWASPNICYLVHRLHQGQMTLVSRSPKALVALPPSPSINDCSKLLFNTVHDSATGSAEHQRSSITTLESCSPAWCLDAKFFWRKKALDAFYGYLLKALLNVNLLNQEFMNEIWCNGTF
jgi:hypothetical protein